MAESIVKSSTEAVLNVAKIGKTRVLHVDDDYAFLKVAKQCLEMQGPFQVDTVSSVEEAKEKMKKETYDAVVSDYMMPGKDGLQFLKELRQKGNSIPFIVFTGKGREEVVIKALNLGADHYENKNGNPETVYSELSHDIINAVRTRRVEQELRIQREELQVILDSMPAKIWYKDRNNRLVRVNKAFAEYMGVSKENLEGKPLGDIFPPGIAQKCWEEDKEVIMTGQPKTDILDRHESAQGVRWFSTGKVPCREKDGSIIGTINFSIDITERKKAEKVLKKREAELSAIIENTSDSVWSIDNKGCLLFANTTFKRQFLLAYGVELKEGMDLKEMVPKAQVPFWVETHNAAIKGGRSSLEHKLEIRGASVNFEISVNPIINENGETVGAAYFSRDITERKKAEQTLKESEEEYRSLVELAPDAIVAVNIEGIVTSANHSFLTLVGYDLEEVVGKPFTELKSSRAEDIPKFQEMFMSLMKGESSSPVEFLYVRRDGTSRWAEVHPSLLIKDGNPVGAQVIMRDITERKKVEEQLRDSENKYHELFETSIDAIATSDMDGHFLDCNQSCQKMLGYSLDEMKKLTYQQLTPEKWHEKEAEIIEKEVMKKGFTAEYEKELIRKDGTVIPVSNRVWATFDEDGKPKTMWGIVRDITERKKTEKMLQESEERFRAIFEGANDGILAVDVKTKRFAFANPRICEIAGYSLEELLKLGVSDIVPKKDLPYVIDSFTEQMQGKLTLSKDMPVLRKDERVVYCDVSSKPTKIGSQEYLIGIFRDVTEHRKAQEDLRDSEERLHILFELAPDAYYLNDLKGNFIDGNKAAEELTGYKKNELVGKSFLKLKLLPRSQALKAAKLLTLNALGKPTGPDEFVLNNKDGIQVPVEIRTYPVRIKDKTVVLGIARDITTRKKDEQAILESQQKFEGLFKHNPEAAVYLDLDSKVLDVNPRFCELFGYSAKEVEGKQINELVVPEGMIEEAEKLDKDAKKGYTSYDTVRKRKDGSLVYVSISAAPVTVESRLLGYVGVYKDITELKNAEERLKKMNERLETTNEKLHVVGGLTRHDVRNKLSAVTGNAYLLKRKLAEDPKALEQLNDMEAAVRLVERIFEFTRVYERLGVEQLVSMDVGKAVDEAVSLFSDLKGVKIVNECGGLTVLADSLLNQLFYNLVDNSLKYGEKIRQIKIHYRTPSANQLELVYEDDGVGIPGNMRSNLFKEGFTSGKGTGYGLFMIKRICEVYGWTIQETGKRGKGAQFTMSIPRMHAKARA